MQTTTKNLSARAKTNMAMEIIQKHLAKAKEEAGLSKVEVKAARYNDMGFTVGIEVEFELSDSQQARKASALELELEMAGIDKKLAHESFQMSGKTFRVKRLKQVNASVEDESGQPYNVKMTYLQRMYPTQA